VKPPYRGWIRRFQSNFALHLLNKVQLANCDRFRPTTAGSNRSSRSIATLGSNVPRKNSGILECECRDNRFCGALVENR
jgi:hypothetical protein